MPCTTCNDKLHIPDNGRWVKCPDCYDQSIINNRIQALPPHAREITLQELTNNPSTTEAAKILDSIIQVTLTRGATKYTVLISPEKGADVTKALTATILKATEVGLATHRHSFTAVSDAYFEAKKTIWKSLLQPSLHLLIVQLGSEIPNASSAPILKELITERKWNNVSTIIFSDISLAAMQRSTTRYPPDLTELLGTFREFHILKDRPNK